MMFGTTFERSMLENLEAYGDGLIILCPTIELFQELMRIASEHGLFWGDGVAALDRELHFYDRFGQETCCWINNKGEIRCGSKGAAEFPEYKRYTKCTICGSDDTTFETEGNDALKSLLGF